MRAGVAREVVRLVQEARKTVGFDVSDRITLVWSADGDTAEALREHGTLVADGGARDRHARGRRTPTSVARAAAPP